MSCAREREYSDTQKVAMITLLLVEKKRISCKEAARYAGCHVRTAQRTLAALCGIARLCVWYDNQAKQYVLGYDEWDERSITFG